MHAAVAAAHAERERAVAEGTRDARRAELTEAEAAAARANADVLNHAAEHSLPSDRRGADDAEQALHGVAAAVSDLKLAVRDARPPRGPPPPRPHPGELTRLGTYRRTPTARRLAPDPGHDRAAADRQVAGLPGRQAWGA
jgi:hypothetical protein